MYSPLVVDRNLFALRKQGLSISPSSVDRSIDTATRLNRLWDPKKSALKRPYHPDEEAFIRSETYLCRLDFRYFTERYGNIALDAMEGGGIGPMKFWQGQLRALDLIATREEEMYDELASSTIGFTEGIYAVWHKARQLGATALMRLITLHRMLLFPAIRCLTASLDEDKIGKIYERDKIILDNLPVFLRPTYAYDVKNEHINLNGLGKVVYQMANQKAGVGTGEQWDIPHLSEVALWPYPERIQFDLFPAIPKAVTTFCGLESTANGRDNFWHELTENVRRKEYGFGHWLYIFGPWYMESRKYRRAAPDDWVPKVHTQAHAEMVERTSAEYCGRTVRLTREQMHWWETERETYRRLGTLHIFLTNFCATPAESFQHINGSALPIETLETLLNRAKMGMPYEVEMLAS